MFNADICSDRSAKIALIKRVVSIDRAILLIEVDERRRRKTRLNSLQSLFTCCRICLCMFYMKKKKKNVSYVDNFISYVKNTNVIEIIQASTCLGMC